VCPHFTQPAWPLMICEYVTAAAVVAFSTYEAIKHGGLCSAICGSYAPIVETADSNTDQQQPAPMTSVGFNRPSSRAVDDSLSVVSVAGSVQPAPLL